MGNFANTLFSVLLGWVQRAVAWLWSLADTDGAGGLMGWVMDNWLLLAVGLCLLGAAVDLIVYIIRWQPYRVWRSAAFFLRRNRQEAEADESESPEAPMQWVYATGEAAPEPAPVPEAAVHPAEPRQPFPERGGQRVFAARDHRTGGPDASAYVQQGYRQAYFPPQWTGGEGQNKDGGTHG